MKGKIVNLSNSSSTFINNGAIVEIPKVSANMIDVNVYGRVNFPGTYPINSTTTLKDILDPETYIGLAADQAQIIIKEIELKRSK